MVTDGGTARGYALATRPAIFRCATWTAIRSATTNKISRTARIIRILRIAANLSAGERRQDLYHRAFTDRDTGVRARSGWCAVDEEGRPGEYREKAAGGHPVRGCGGEPLAHRSPPRAFAPGPTRRDPAARCSGSCPKAVSPRSPSSGGRTTCC